MADSNSDTLRQFLTDLCNTPQMREIIAKRMEDKQVLQTVVVELLKGSRDDDGPAAVPDTVVNILNILQAMPDDVALKYAETGQIEPGKWLVPTNGKGRR